jgi:AcrR family transcriptional regulator
VTERKRQYRSPAREEQARLTTTAVLDAATTCFVRRGYARTTMKDIAESAGVSAQTVYLQGNKVSLLLAAVHRAIIDDNSRLPAHSRDGDRDQLGVNYEERKLRELTTITLGRLPASIPILQVFREAAPTDPAIAQAWEEHERRRYAHIREFVQSCTHLLRCDLTVERATDIVFSAIIAPAVTEAFINERGWSTDNFMNWMIEAFDRLLSRPEPEPNPHHS